MSTARSWPRSSARATCCSSSATARTSKYGARRRPASSREAVLASRSISPIGAACRSSAGAPAAIRMSTVKMNTTKPASAVSRSNCRHSLTTSAATCRSQRPAPRARPASWLISAP